MKNQIKGRSKFENKMSQLASKVYSEKRIIDKSLHATHNGETMEQVFNNIMNDPHISFGKPSKSDNRDILYDGVVIGWINFERYIGEIKEEAYNLLEKYVKPEKSDDFECLEYVFDIVDDEGM